MAVLISFSSNYADEFDVEGFVIIDTNTDPTIALSKYVSAIETEWRSENEDDSMEADEDAGEDAYEPIDVKAYPHEWYFGTNESINFNTWDDLHGSFESEYITDEAAAQVINAMGGEYENGRFYFGLIPQPN